MTRTRLSIAIALVVMCGNGCYLAAQPPGGFSTQGLWQVSSLTGPTQKRSLWSSDPSAKAFWNPQIGSVSPVRISFYVVAHDGNAAATLLVMHEGHREVVPINMQRTESLWVSIGTFEFSGNDREYIQLTRSSAGNLRIAALRLEILDPHQTGVVWQNLVLDDIAPGTTPGLERRFVNFSDINDPATRQAAGILVGFKILSASNDGTFSPGQALSGEDLRVALVTMGELAAAPLSSPGFMRLTSQPALTGLQFLSAVVESARKSGKNLEWIAPGNQDPVSLAQRMGLLQFPGGQAFSSLTVVTKGNAALALKQFKAVVVDSGPPSNAMWHLSFHDEFNECCVDWNVWGSDSGQLRGLSTRWPENAIVSDGVLHLLVKEERRGGGSWTAANLWTKGFHQTYGYWEARFRYAGGSGLNNAFWMMHDLNSANSDSFEIDVNEGHYPSEINMTLHQNALADDSTMIHAPEDLSADFHTYGCLWNSKELVFYMDGKEISRKRNSKANDSVPVILSTAVISWAGVPHPTNLDGKSMDVDWVRVYAGASRE